MVAIALGLALKTDVPPFALWELVLLSIGRPYRPRHLKVPAPQAKT